jgi:hypothetical protein
MGVQVVRSQRSLQDESLADAPQQQLEFT